MKPFIIAQGDSILIPFFLTLNESEELTPEMVDDVEVFSGTEYDVLFRKTFSEGTVAFDEKQGEWCFRLSQEDTMDLEPDSYKVSARVKIGEDVVRIVIGQILIQDSPSRKVL